jgi:prepilin-type N-terminal cleavage/methylation domain-containing protein/prepilin-type processing-associated H-X9-DG protein
MTSVSRQRKGFTLIELLTVIAIIGVLAAVLFPGVQGVMRSAKKNSALNKLRSIGQGYMNWAQGGKVMTRTGTWTAAGNVATKTSEYAANLAAGAALDSGELWFVDGDAMLERNTIPNLPKNVIRTSAGVISVDPLFIAAITAGTGTSWTVNAGAWPAADGSVTGSCWGPEGGHIVYGDGHVSWCTNTLVTGQNYFTDTTGAPTANWLQSRSVPASALALPQQ